MTTSLITGTSTSRAPSRTTHTSCAPVDMMSSIVPRRRPSVSITSAADELEVIELTLFKWRQVARRDHHGASAERLGRVRVVDTLEHDSLIASAERACAAAL